MTSTSAYANANGHGLGAQAVSYALQLVHLQIPYVYGGETLSGMDCSGLTQWVWDRLGVKLPRTSQEQATAGTVVPYSQAQPGDLLIYSEPGEGPNSHVGIFAGNGQQIEEAHPGTNARVSGIDFAHLTSVVRPFGVGTASATDANWIGNLLQGLGNAATGDPFIPGSGSGTQGNQPTDPLSGMNLSLSGLGTSIAGTVITGLLALGAVALVGVGLYRGTQNPTTGEEEA